MDPDTTIDENIDGGANGEATAAEGAGEAAPPSLDDTARAALAAIKARNTEGAEGNTESGAETSPDGASVDRGDGRTATGQFASKKKEGQEPQLGADGKPGTPPAEGQAPAEGQQGANTNPDNLQHVGHDGRAYPVDITQAPRSWRQEAQALYAQLPEAVRREVYKRENDFHRGLSESRGWANVGQMLDKEIRPYEAIIRAEGIGAEKVVATLLNNAYVFKTGSPEEKASLLLDLVDRYGITPEAIQAVNQRRKSGQPAVDPNVRALQDRLDERDRRDRDEATRREQSAQAEATSVAERFLADPKNEHARDVHGEMVQLLQSGGANTIEDAYNKAIWINPTVRAKLIAKQQADERKRQADEAAKARKAASANVSRRGGPPDVTPKGTLEDTARRTLAAIRARGSGD